MTILILGGEERKRNENDVVVVYVITALRMAMVQGGNFRPLSSQPQPLTRFLQHVSPFFCIENQHSIWAGILAH